MIHSRLSPSSGHRWAYCTASVQFCESINLPPELPSEYAEEGINAHVVFAEALALHNPFEVVYTTHEEREYLPGAIEYIMSIRAQHPEAPLYSEIRVDPALFVKTIHCRGTADVIIPVDLGPLYVADLKFGIHVSVDVIDNIQLILYGLGALAKFEAKGYVFTEIVLAILQPRGYHPDGINRQWRVSRDELVVWGRWLGERAREALGPAGVFRPEPEGACWWCPATGVCKAFAYHELSIAREVFSDIDTDIEYRDLNALSHRDLSFLLQSFPGMRRWMSSVSEYSKSVLENEGKIPYWGLKKKFSNRIWALSREELEQYFDPGVLYETKLRTPPQIEKILGKHSVDNFAKREITGHTIFAIDDPEDTEEINPFGDLDDAEEEYTI